MKLIILTQYYPPEVGAPQARLSELARRFVGRGHTVHIVTAMPNYPAARIHDGYGGLIRRERCHGTSIMRTFIYPAQSAALLPRLASYGSFAVSSALLAPAFLRKADYLMVESPPLFLGPTGWWLSLWTRARLIFNVSDLWPESAVHVGVVRRESRAFRAAARLEAFCYRRAWLVTGQARSIISDVQSRFPGVKTFHLSNGVDTNRFHPGVETTEARRALGGPDGTVVLYAGLHGLAQGLEQLVEAAARLRDQSQFRLVLVGDGPEKAKLVEDARRRGLTNIDFLEPRTFAEMPGLLAAADVIVVPLKAAIPGAVPSKLYEAMASGRPTVLVGTGEAAEVVREHDAGIVVDPGDVDSLVAAIRQLGSSPDLCKRLGESGRRGACESFDRDKICGRFIDHLEGVQ